MAPNETTPFPLDDGDIARHASLVDSKNQYFLKSVTLLENNLQNFLAHNPVATNKAILERKAGAIDYLDRIDQTRDRINELMGLLSLQKAPDQKWIIKTLPQGSPLREDQAIWLLINSMTRCQNAIWGMVTHWDHRLASLQKMTPSIPQLGGRFLGIKSGLAETLKRLSTANIHGITAQLVESSIHEHNLELEQNRYPFEIQATPVNQSFTHSSETTETAPRPLPKPKSNKKKTPTFDWSKIQTKFSNEKKEQPGPAESLMAHFKPTLPPLKLNPAFAKDYPWLEDEDLYPIEKTASNSEAYNFFKRSLWLEKDETVVAIQRAGLFRPLTIKSIALMDPVAVQNEQAEQQRKEDEESDWDSLEKAESSLDRNTDSIQPRRRNAKKSPK